MLRTITIGSSLMIQGFVIGTAPDGRLMVRVGERIFTGHPVPSLTRKAA